MLMETLEAVAQRPLPTLARVVRHQFILEVRRQVVAVAASAEAAASEAVVPAVVAVVVAALAVEASEDADSSLLRVHS